MDFMQYDVAVIGAGPAGLAAALSAKREGAKVLLIEREGRLGGILKQCIHDGFGLVRFGEKMAGPEYAQYFINEISKESIDVSLLTFVTKIEKSGKNFLLTLVCNHGIQHIKVTSLVLSTGCRERTAKQISIHGSHPSGIFTAGTAQYFTNILGELPTKQCVILGSGDIGLIMARRLTLEGAKVLGVYEAKPTPSGLSRNISQCLLDFNIPLYTSKTVTRVFGKDRLEAVEISDVDTSMQPIAGTEQILSCDSLILSVGLIPENELAESLGIEIDPKTKGPIADQNYMTKENGVFICGNALHVNDLVDYVSESGEEAGRAAAHYKPSLVKNKVSTVTTDASLLYAVPQNINLSEPVNKITFFFRSRTERTASVLQIFVDGKEIYHKKYRSLRPPEMERIEVDFSKVSLNEQSKISLSIKEVGL